MTTSHNNNSQKENKMEFSVKDDVVVLDETKANVFGKKQVITSATDSISIELSSPCKSEDPACTKRWIDSLSDCA